MKVKIVKEVFDFIKNGNIRRNGDITEYVTSQGIFTETNEDLVFEVTNLKRKFICWYAYSGMETEGNLYLNEPQAYDALDVAEAMWKYHNYLYSRGEGNNMREYYKDVDDFRKRAEYITGWGFRCEELK